MINSLKRSNILINISQFTSLNITLSECSSSSSPTLVVNTGEYLQQLLRFTSTVVHTTYSSLPTTGLLPQPHPPHYLPTPHHHDLDTNIYMMYDSLFEIARCLTEKLSLLRFCQTVSFCQTRCLTEKISLFVWQNLSVKLKLAQMFCQTRGLTEPPKNVKNTNILPKTPRSGCLQTKKFHYFY